jgi:hypothetical protein
MIVGNQERDIIALVVVRKQYGYQASSEHTLIGFLRRIKKASARWVRNLVNL